MTDSVVLVSSSFPIRGDGSEAAGSFVADLVDELAKQVSVRVVAPGPSIQRERWSNRVEVFRYAAPARPLSTLKPWWPADLRWITRVLYGGLQATRAAVVPDTSHVLALWGLPCGEWVRRVACERNIGYSVWMLGSDVWSLGRVPVLRGMLARVIRGAAHAYADGYKLAEDARRISGAEVAFLPSTRQIGPNKQQAPRSQAPYRFLFLGRWHRNKGVDLLLDALTLLTDADWANIERVEIQGGGPLDAQVRQQVATLHAAGRPVEAGGFLKKADAEEAISRADWILIPSRIESIPVVFSDAMKLRRPVIATPVGDLPRLLTEFRSGVLCPVASAQGLLQGIREALHASAADAAQTLDKAAQAFSLAAVAQRLLEYAE